MNERSSLPLSLPRPLPLPLSAGLLLSLPLPLAVWVDRIEVSNIHREEWVRGWVNSDPWRTLFFFYCIAELEIKPCRSSRSKTRGGLRNSMTLAKGKQNTTKQQQNPNQTQTPTRTTKTRQVSMDGETGGEKE